MKGSLFKRSFRKGSIVHSLTGNFEILVRHSWMERSRKLTLWIPSRENWSQKFLDHSVNSPFEVFSFKNHIIGGVNKIKEPIVSKCIMPGKQSPPNRKL